MKILFLFLSLFFLPTAHASRPDIDTVSIAGINPGTDGKILASLMPEKMDTLLWNDDGTGITKFKGSYLNAKGEFRIAFSKGFVSQISFVAPTHNADETKKIYSELTSELIRQYGPADIESANAIHEMRWEGMKQSISVKAEDGAQYVTISLSRFETGK